MDLVFLLLCMQYFNTHQQPERDLLPVVRAVPGHAAGLGSPAANSLPNDSASLSWRKKKEEEKIKRLKFNI